MESQRAGLGNKEIGRIKIMRRKFWDGAKMVHGLGKSRPGVCLFACHYVETFAKENWDIS